MEDFQYYLFKLDQLGGRGDKHNTVLILSDSENLPTPCPGIMRQKDIETALRGDFPAGRRFAHAVIPFSLRNGSHPRYKVGVASSIMPIDSKQLIDGHRIEVLDKFPLNSLKEISIMARERGGVSFIIKDRKEMSRTVSNLLKVSKKTFEYVECFKAEHNVSNAAGHGDNLALSVTLMDLPYCIPIYDSRRVDGVGLIFSLFYPQSTEKKGSLRYHDLCAVLLSNYADNIFKIDGGSVVNRRSGTPGGLAEHLISVIKHDAERAKNEEKQVASGPVGKPKAKKAKTAGEMVKQRLVSKSSGTATYFTSGSTTSSTSTW